MQKALEVLGYLPHVSEAFEVGVSFRPRCQWHLSMGRLGEQGISDSANWRCY